MKTCGYCRVRQLFEQWETGLRHLPSFPPWSLVPATGCWPYRYCRAPVLPHTAGATPCPALRNISALEVVMLIRRNNLLSLHVFKLTLLLGGGQIWGRGAQQNSSGPTLGRILNKMTKLKFT